MWNADSCLHTHLRFARLDTRLLLESTYNRKGPLRLQVHQRTVMESTM